MNSWLQLYERLIGRPPTPTQTVRMDRVRSILRLRDYDSFWYFVVVCDFYVHLIEAGTRRFDAIREDIAAAQRRPTLGWADLASALRRPPLVVAATVLFVFIAGAPALTTIALLERQELRRDQASTDAVAQMNAEVVRRLDGLSFDLARLGEAVEQGAKASDPNLRALINALQQLQPDDVGRLASDPLLTRSLHVFATLSPEVRSSFVSGNDPDNPLGQRRQQALPWLSAQVTGDNPVASKLVAAFAANNSRLIGFLRTLPDTCGLMALDACK